MKVHFIAIGGSAMHNLAIALRKKAYTVTGSDDEIFEPSRSRLKNYNILPESEGWNTDRIHKGLDAVILGMHAKENNPELLKAKKLGLKIFSYPEYLFEQSKNKKRVVIGGSHGKTTITSMILHVLNFYNIDCDFMVGAQLKGFEVMVKITENAPVMIFEGDEYLTSPLDRRPKFHLYKPDIALISGIAWDHINVFPTFDNYVSQFKIFADLITEKGTLIYCNDDKEVEKIGTSVRKDISSISYSIPEHTIENGITKIIFNNKKIPLKVFGEHNLMNINGARLVCNKLSVTDEEFYKAIQSFAGASKRLETVAQNQYTVFFKDFAHSPSKLVATTNAVKKQFINRKLVACIELHTYSSLNKKFLSHYKGCLDNADIAMVYFNPHTIKLKKLPPITKEQVKEAFANRGIKVYTNSSRLLNDLLKINWKNKNLLMMSSGNFDGIDFNDLGEKIIAKQQ
ncbi:MAG: peptidoglycan synthetase [Bacteroidetes bacterium 4484_249]|nr:MAG: peptidoglycan synthetase [Bacteroidetes bacterium 4484_249]